MEFIDLKAQQARVREDIERRMAAVLDHGRYVLGPEVDELEEILAGFVGVGHCITVASGTDALVIALMALGIGPGDEVITVPYTWISSAEAIALVGATPVFVDIEPDTWNLDPNLLEAAITDRCKAIIPVGIYGQTADMRAIGEVASRCGQVPVIEDAAQCFGATHHGLRSCGLSEIGCTSFFPSKPLGCYGEGGAVFTDNHELAEKIRQIRVHGQHQRHSHPVLGMNGRFDTLQAAVLLAKWHIFEDELAMRQAVAERYLQMVPGINGVAQAQIVRPGNTSVWAQFTLLLDDRDRFSGHLERAGIPSVAYYSLPVHLQPVFGGLGYQRGDFPVTESVSDQCLSLPMSPYVTEADFQEIQSAAMAGGAVST